MMTRYKETSERLVFHCNVQSNCSYHLCSHWRFKLFCFDTARNLLSLSRRQSTAELDIQLDSSSCDLHLDQMTLMYETDLDILKVYPSVAAENFCLGGRNFHLGVIAQGVSGVTAEAIKIWKVRTIHLLILDQRDKTRQTFIGSMAAKKLDW